MAVSSHQPQDNFAGFGRVVERSAPPDQQDVKVPWIHEGGQSSTSTTWRDLSDRTQQLTPSRVSPCEASLICQGALAELAVDTVVVVVIKYARGVVVGRLQCDAEEPHEVIFTLLQIKPGYSIVGDVLEGPELFGRVCWKLRSISGCSDADPSWIGKGDVLILEGPRWATQRLLRTASGDPSGNAASFVTSAHQVFGDMSSKARPTLDSARYRETERPSPVPRLGDSTGGGLADANSSSSSSGGGRGGGGGAVVQGYGSGGSTGDVALADAVALAEALAAASAAAPPLAAPVNARSVSQGPGNSPPCAAATGDSHATITLDGDFLAGLSNSFAADPKAANGYPSAAELDLDDWRAAGGPALTGDPCTRTATLKPNVPRLNLSRIHEPKDPGRCDDGRCRFTAAETLLCKDAGSAGCRPTGGLEQCLVM